MVFEFTFSGIQIVDFDNKQARHRLGIEIEQALDRGRMITVMSTCSGAVDTNSIHVGWCILLDLKEWLASLWRGCFRMLTQAAFKPCLHMFVTNPLLDSMNCHLHTCVIRAAPASAVYSEMQKKVCTSEAHYLSLKNSY